MKRELDMHPQSLLSKPSFSYMMALLTSQKLMDFTMKTKIKAISEDNELHYEDHNKSFRCLIAYFTSDTHNLHYNYLIIYLQEEHFHTIYINSRDNNTWSLISQMLFSCALHWWTPHGVMMLWGWLVLLLLHFSAHSCTPWIRICIPCCIPIL